MISITNDMLHPNKPLTNSRYDFSLYRQLFFNLLRIVFNNFSVSLTPSYQAPSDQRYPGMF